MIIEMLKAVSEMLRIPDGDNAAQAGAKVDCAKLMLDGIIMGMEREQSPNVINVDLARGKGLAEEPKWYCTKDAVSGNFKIVGTPPEGTQIELDGKVYPWKEAVGKPFKKGKVL